MTSYDPRTPGLLPSLNTLLSRHYLPTLTSPTELSPSLLIALYESIHQSRLQSINRRDKSRGEQIRNVKLLLGYMTMGGWDVGAVDPVGVVEGEEGCLMDLVEVLVEIGREGGIDVSSTARDARQMEHEDERNPDSELGSEEAGAQTETEDEEDAVKVQRDKRRKQRRRKPGKPGSRELELSTISEDSEESIATNNTIDTLEPLHTKASAILTKIHSLNPSLTSPLRLSNPSRPPHPSPRRSQKESYPISPGSTISRATQTSPPNATEGPAIGAIKTPLQRRKKKGPRGGRTRVERGIQTDDEEGIPSSIPMSYESQSASASESDIDSSPETPRRRQRQLPSRRTLRRPPAHRLLSPRGQYTSDTDFDPRIRPMSLPPHLFPQLSHGTLSPLRSPLHSHLPPTLTTFSPSVRSVRSVRSGSRSSGSETFRVDSPYTATLRRRRQKAIESLRNHQTSQSQRALSPSLQPHQNPSRYHQKISPGSPLFAHLAQKSSPFRYQVSRSRGMDRGRRHKVRVFSVGRDVADSTFAEDSDNTPRPRRRSILPPVSDIDTSFQTRTLRHSLLGTRSQCTAQSESPRRRRKRDGTKDGRDGGGGRVNPRGRGSGRLQMDPEAMESTTEGLTDLERRVQAMRIWGGIEEERKEFLMQEIRKREARSGII